MGLVMLIIGVAGIVLSPIIGWSDVSSPWDFVLGFIFGVIAGIGFSLTLFGLITRGR
jgi:hypothetical protein